MEDEEGVLEVSSIDTKRWRDKEGRLHRLDGPAVTHADGDRSWYTHGKLHRDDGPALDWPSEGIKQWFKNGEPYEPSAHDLMLWKMKLKTTQDFM
jgi:hypothetical protein